MKQQYLIEYNPSTTSLHKVDLAWMRDDMGQKKMKRNRYIFIIRSPSNEVLYVFSNNPGFSVLDIVFKMLDGFKLYNVEYAVFNGTGYTCLERLVLTRIEELEEFLNRNLIEKYHHITPKFYVHDIESSSTVFNFWARSYIGKRGI